MPVSSATDLLQEALALHRRGAVAEAATRYAEVLRADPGNADAHYYLGMMSCQQGRFAEGAEHARKSLAGDPRHARAHVLLGRALSAQGRHEDALASIERAIALMPDLAQAHGHRADVLSDLGRHAEAVESYDRALALAPDAVADWFNRGVALIAVGRPDEAIASFDRAIAGKPDFAEAHLLRAKLLLDLRRYDDALAAYDRALELNPDLAEAWLGRGNILSELKRYDDGFAAYDRALTLKPDLTEAWLGRGNVLVELKRCDDAFAAYDRALALNPKLAGAWLGRGNVFFKLEQYDNAFAAYEGALALKGDLAEAWLGRGNVFNELKYYDDGFAAYDRALTLKPDLTEAWLGRGNVLVELKRYDDGFAAYDRALTLKPDLADAWQGRGNAFYELRRYDDAFAAYDRALALNLNLAGAWLGRGNVFFKLKQYDNAFAAYDSALALKGDLAEAWLGRGNVFNELKRYDDGLAAYDRALTLKPNLAEAWHGRGTVFTKLKRYDDAFAAYDRAVVLKPDLNHALSERFSSKLQMCNWTDLGTEVAQLLATIREQKSSSVPFTILAIPSSAADQLQCAKRYVQDQLTFPQIWCGEIYSHDRIRVAYLSADFREHPVAYLTVGLFEQHDKSRFEVTGISFGPDENSTMRHRIRDAFEHFMDVQHQSDQNIADLIRRLEIDIVIDLMGFTQHNRLDILARRVAPVQVNYLGYPGTMGANYIDYIIADPTIIPADQRAFYTEQVVWLPETYQVNDKRRHITERVPTRRECGLPDAAFVFCCFNNSYKITPEVFDIWMRLLKQIDGSVLWLKENDAVASHNLRLEAERRGVAPERLVFAPPVSLVADHLARHRQADLFLDTLPYNAHTTASDALWAGLPVLTCLGATFAGRVAGSVLKSIGLDELVARSLEDYEALALKLAREPSYLACIREKLARNRNTFPLFNTERAARQIESAYVMMWERYQKREMPHATSDQSKPIRIA